MGESTEIRCLFTAEQGKKATQMGKVAEIRCLPAAEQGKKATQMGKVAKIRCLPANFSAAYHPTSPCPHKFPKSL